MIPSPFMHALAMVMLGDASYLRPLNEYDEIDEHAGVVAGAILFSDDA